MAGRDSTLQFASGSQRDLFVPYWYNAQPAASWDAILRRRYRVQGARRLQLGDCTAHHGWTYHLASPQRGAPPRTALAFSYVAADATRLPDLTNAEGVRVRPDRVFQREDEISWGRWYDAVPDGRPIDHPLLPRVG